ncbi:MAG: hypothetical protein ACYDCQ_00960 [Dehalococcoidia bacterium]
MHTKQWRAAARVPRVLPLLAAVLLLPALARPVAAQSSEHTLTQADNGSTIAVTTGDTVSLRLGTDLDWSNSVMLSDSTVLRALPFALVRGVQGVWRAVETGQTTISATGRPICAPDAPCPLFLATFSATIIVTGPPPPPPSGSVTYPVGWNIVGGPAGSEFPVTLYRWEPERNQYASLAPNTPVERGRGYWAYFSQPTTVLLAGDSGSSMPSGPGQQYLLIANPSSSQCAGINVGPPMPPGSSRGPVVLSVYTYDPAQGSYSSGAGALLTPGEGAWVVLDRPGMVPITPAGAPGADGNCIAPP